MGTSKPLNIAIPWEWKDEPWVKALEAKGHTIFPQSDWVGNSVDLILAPNCARFLPGMHEYLDSFIKGARLIKYGTTKASKAKETDSG